MENKLLENIEGFDIIENIGTSTNYSGSQNGTIIIGDLGSESPKRFRSQINPTRDDDHLEFENKEFTQIPSDFSQNPSIIVHDNPNLLKINSFHLLQIILGSIYLINNDRLSCIFAFEEIENLIDLYIKNNPCLEKISAFHRTKYARDIIIANSKKLIKLASFENLGTCQHLYIESNTHDSIKFTDNKKIMSGFLIYSE